ncbi:MAG: IS1634 family transposase [Gammaproteobacteria bacterium]
MFIRTQTNGDRTYLLLVENERVDGRLVQRVLYRLGRLDQLQASGQLDGVVKSLGRFSEKLLVLDAHARGESVPTQTVTIGPALILERLWRECGIADVLAERVGRRRFGFSVERAIFLTVLHRLFAPGSDRAAERWRHDYAIPGATGLELHQLYRAMRWLGTPLPKAQQTGATPFAPRTTKDLIEEALFARRRDIFSQLHVVFFDTTSLYFHGTGGDTLGRYGHSRDHRPDLKQMVVGMVLDDEGRPICTELWPGNTTDVTTLIPIVDRLKQTFHVEEVCVVADRGMISAQTIDELEARGWTYILGVRMRSSKEAQAIAATDEGHYHTVFPRRRTSHDPAPLRVKQVWRDDRRYIVCVNPDEADKDRHDRAAIVAALEKALTQGDKSLIGNKGFRRFLKTTGTRFAIDDTKITADAQYDGKWVLRTNTGLAMDIAALAYKHLFMVEAIFRSMKSLLETRPIYHQKDETIRGHVFCSFLALVLRQELERRLAAQGWPFEWADIIRDLDHLQETTITVDEKDYVIRSQIKGTLGKVFQATGVAIPPAVRPA